MEGIEYFMNGETIKQQNLFSTNILEFWNYLYGILF